MNNIKIKIFNWYQVVMLNNIYLLVPLNSCVRLCLWVGKDKTIALSV